MIGEVLAIAKTAYTALEKPLRLSLTKVRVWAYHRRQRPPLTEDEARQIAFSVLAGDVLRAVSFRNMGSGRIYIASMRRSSEVDFDLKVYLLEQVGQSFKPIWNSEVLYAVNPSVLEARDMDGDGNFEIVFEDHSYGNGGGSRTLLIYVVISSRLYSIKESLNWQDRSGPTAPQIETTPPIPQEMLRALETTAKAHGFLCPPAIADLDSSEFSVHRWHKENGVRTSGKIRIHHYAGFPPTKASLGATLDTGTTLWISFFKGPLVGYDRIAEQHFVAFSPSWSYNWATCLAFDGECLWFGSHCRKGLMGFRTTDSALQSYETYREMALPDVSELRIDGDFLVLNGSIPISLDALKSKFGPEVKLSRQKEKTSGSKAAIS